MLPENRHFVEDYRLYGQSLVLVETRIGLMIYPMMLRMDFTSILGVRKRPGG